MVMIPIVERKVTELPGAALVPKASDEAFGAAIGRATSQLGSQITQVGSSLAESLKGQQDEQDAVTAKIETSNHEARVMQYINELQQKSAPETALDVPRQVREFATRDAAETLGRIPQRYQGTASVHINSLHNRATTSLQSWSLQQSFDYQGSRILKASGEQAAMLMDNPADVARAAGAIRSIADETNLPGWKKAEVKQQAGLQLMQSVLQGYANRNDSVGGREALKTLQSTLPEMLGLTATQPGAAPRAVLSPTDRDNVIRTIWGEARGETPEGQEAIANIIRNRVVSGRYGGRTATDVVLKQNAFEPWGNPEARTKMQALKPTDASYQSIGEIVDQVFQGQKPDNTGGATHFYSPKVQGELGRKAPDWATNKLASIGTHEFYAPEGVVKPSAQPVLSGKPLEIASSMLGTDERAHREVLSKFIGQIGGKNVDPATTAWCAAFVNAVLAKTGQPGTDSLMARSFLNYGTPTDKPAEGDIVVLSRGNDPNKGHVGFYAGEGEGGSIKILGGNQDDSVSIKEFPASQVLGYRRVGQGDVAARPIQVAQAGQPTMAGFAGADKWQAVTGHYSTLFNGIDNKNKEQQDVERALTDTRLKNEAASIRTLGDKGRDPTLTTEKLTKLYSPEYVNNLEAQRQANLEFWSVTNNWASKTPLQIQEDVKRLDPKLSLPGPDFLTRDENFKAAQGLADTIDKAREKAMKQLGQDAMREVYRRSSDDKLDRDFVERAAPFLSPTEYNTALKLLPGAAAAENDPKTLTKLVPQVDSLTPQEFQKEAQAEVLAGRLKPETYISLSERNRNAQKDDAPASAYKSGREFVKTGLDPGLLSGSAEVVLRQAQARGLIEYDNWAAANPQLSNDRAASAAMASEIVQRYATVNFGQIKQSIGLSRYMPVTDRTKVTLDVIDAAEQKVFAEGEAGKLSTAQYDFEIRQLTNWREILTKEQAALNIKAPAGGAKAPAKPAAPAAPASPRPGANVPSDAFPEGMDYPRTKPGANLPSDSYSSAIDYPPRPKPGANLPMDRYISSGDYPKIAPGSEAPSDWYSKGLDYTPPRPGANVPSDSYTRGLDYQDQPPPEAQPFIAPRARDGSLQVPEAETFAPPMPNPTTSEQGWIDWFRHKMRVR